MILLQTQPSVTDWTQLLAGIGGFIRETGFLGVGILLVLAIWKRILVPGPYFEETIKRAEAAEEARDKLQERVDRQQDLIDSLTKVTQRSTDVMEATVRRRRRSENMET